MKKTTKIRGIFFDLGWTLMAPVNGDWMITKRFKQLCDAEQTTDFSTDRIQKAKNTAAEYLNRNHKMKSVREEEQQFADFYELLGKNLPELRMTHEKALDIAHDRVHNMANYRILQGTIPVLERLKSEGFRLGVISDTWPSVRNQLDFFQLSKYFDSLTFSYELGVFKPNTAMYEDALQKMALPADQTIFVDDMEQNLDAAKRMEINGIQSLAEPGKISCGKYPVIKFPEELMLVKYFDAKYFDTKL